MRTGIIRVYRWTCTCLLDGKYKTMSQWLDLDFVDRTCNPEESHVTPIDAGGYFSKTEVYIDRNRRPREHRIVENKTELLKIRRT